MKDDNSDFVRSETPKSVLSRGGSMVVDIILEDKRDGEAILEWQNITVTKVSKAKKTDLDPSHSENLTTLSNVNGVASPNELLAIIGPDNSGKNTLLQVLGARPLPGLTTEGLVGVNHQALTRPMARRLIAYVNSNDLFIDTLLVREHLLFQARLLDPRGLHSEEEHYQHIDHVIHDNGLTTVQDNLIGSLSPALKKRLAIASALVGHASILLVEEPTMDLDSFAAASVVSQLKHIACHGKTVVVTMSKPTSDEFVQFDKVMLLGAGGKVLYHGPTGGVVEYFGGHGHVPSVGLSTVDFLLEKASVASELPSFPWEKHPLGSDDAGVVESGSARVKTLADAWEAFRDSSAYHSLLSRYQTEAVINENESIPKPIPITQANSSGVGRSLHEVVVLAQRHLKRLRHTKMTFSSLTVQPIVASVFAGLIYLQPNMDQLGYQSFSSSLFIQTVILMMMNGVGQLGIAASDLVVPLRESQAGMYDISSWYLAKNLTELPLQIIQPIVFLFPVFFMVGYNHSVELFVYMAVILILAVSCAFGFAYMVACLTRRTGATVVIGVALLIPMMILGGALVNPRTIRDYWIWIEYISPFKYCYEALMRLFWERIGSISCAPTGTCSIASGRVVLLSRALLDRTPWTSGLALVALNVGFRFIGLLSLVFM